jgi:TP901 family phage tail tape measure protein
VAGKNDFVLKLGFKIDAKGISKSALRAALNKAAQGAVLTISKVKLANPAKARKDITSQIGTIKIDNLSVSASAAKSLARAINTKVRPEIKGLHLSANSLSNIRKSLERALSNVSVNARPARAASGGGAGSSGSGRQSSGPNTIGGGTVAQEAQLMKDKLIRLAKVQRQSIALMSTQDKAAIRVAAAMRQGGLSANEMGSRIAQVTKRFTEYAVSVKGLQALQSVFRTAAAGVKEFDTATRDLAKVSTVTPDIEKSFRAISKTALGTGRSIGDASTAIGEFVRQGKDLATAAKFANKALQLTNISNLNAANSARLVTAAQQVFGITAEGLGDTLSKLAFFADSSATSVTEVGTAFLRTASSASSAGLSIDQTFAILASTLEQTRLNASTVGTAFKTIFARLGRDRGKVAKLANSFTGLRSSSKEFLHEGLAIKDFLPRLARSFKGLNSDQKNLVALQVAGVRQANVFIAALENWDKSTELLERRQEAQGELARKNAEDLKKLSSRAIQTSVAFKTLAASLFGLEGGKQGGAAGFLGNTLDGARDTLLALAKSLQVMNDLSGSSVRAGDLLSSGLVGALAGAAGTLIPAIINGFRQMGRSTAQIGIAARSVNTALSEGNAISRTQLATDREILKVRLQQAVASRSAAGIVTRGGVASRNARTGGGGATDPSRGQLGRGAALGFAAFAAADAINSWADELSNRDGIDAVEKSQIKLAASASSQAIVLGSIAGPFGAAVGAFLGAVTSISTSLTEWNDTMSTIAQQGLTSNLTALSADSSLDLDIASREAQKLVIDLNATIQEQLKSQNIGDGFRSAILEATSSITVALNASILELNGLPSAAAKLISEIELLKSKGDFVSTTVAPEGLTGSAAQVQRKDLFGDAAIQSIVDGEADSIHIRNEEILKAEAFAKEAQASVDAASLAALEAKRSIQEVNSAYGKLIEEFGKDTSGNSDGLARIAQKFLDLEDSATKSGASAIETYRGIIDSLSGQVETGRLSGPIAKLLGGNISIDIGIKDNKSALLSALTGTQESIDLRSEGALAGLEAARAKSGEILGDAQKRTLELTKEATSRVKELTKLQASLSKHLETGVNLSQVMLDTISKESLEAKSKLDSEGRILELKKGTLAQQAQAIVLAKRLTLESDANLKKIEEQIALNKSEGGSDKELKALQAIRGQALESLDKRARQQAQPGIDSLVKEDKEDRRAKALANVQTVTDNLAKVESARAKALRELQDSQKKVLTLQKKVSAAGQEVDAVMLSIAAAQRNMANVVKKSFETIRTSVRAALSSAGFENITSIATSLNTVISLEQRLSVLRREGLEQALEISQKQASSLLTIGEKLATGGPGARLDLQRGLSTASAIQGGADISSFTPDDLKLALGVKELFPGLREAISTQSLVSVGLSDELSSLRGNISSAAGALATEDVSEQLRVASAQLSAQLQELDQAKNAERIAIEDLKLARGAVAIGARGLSHQVTAVREQKNLIGEVKRNNAIVEVRLAKMLEAQLSGNSKFDNMIAQLRSNGISNMLSHSARDQLENAARGTLSGQEMRGLEDAARREKSLMPAGSKLMMANTSETVLTRRQSKSMGFSPRSQTNAAVGNADVSDLSVIMSQLLSETRQLNARVGATGVNNVNLQVDTNKSVNIKGLSGLGNKLKSELRNKFASGSDVAAIESAIMDIISKLGEAGLADDLGR